MTEFTYTIDKTYHTITPSFKIKQIYMNNPSKYGVYINFSSAPPTAKRSDYYLAPNAVYTTPEVSYDSVTWFAPNFIASSKNPTIVVRDTPTSMPIATPYDFYQFVSVPNYPFSVSLGSPTTIVLPDILIDKFQNIFFTMKRWGSSLNAACILTDGLNRIGGFNQGGGVVSYTPTKIPDTISPTLQVQNFWGGLPSVNSEVNVFITSDQLNEAYPIAVTGVSLDNSTPTVSMTFYGNAPGYIFSLTATDNPISGGSFAIDVTIDLYVTTGNSAQLRVFSQNIVTTMPFPYAYLITPKLRLLADHSFFRLDMTNNVPASARILWPNFMGIL